MKVIVCKVWKLFFDLNIHITLKRILGHIFAWGKFKNKSDSVHKIVCPCVRCMQPLSINKLCFMKILDRKNKLLEIQN